MSAFNNSNSSKKTIVFFCTHHSGHLNPILSLMKQYVQHQDEWNIYFFSDPAVQTKIENAGATFLSIGDLNVHDASATTIEDRFHLEQTPDVKNYFFPLEILPATVYYMDPVHGLLNRVKALNPTAIVCDVSALWGILTAKLLDVPLITSCSCTLFENLDGPFGHFRTIDYLQKSAEWIKETYGIEYDPVEAYMNESDYTVSFSSPEFQPPSRQNSDNVKFYGPAMELDYETYIKNEERKDLALSDNDGSLLKWLEDGKKLNPNRKVIYCSLGTVVGQEPWTILERNADDKDMVAYFYEKVFNVMKAKGDEYQCIISIGKDRSVDDIKSSIPSNVKCLQRVPQVLVLEHSDVFITHCGNNGVHESFFTKTPMICIPVFGDQHPNAQSICNLNAGVQISSPFAPLPSPNLDHVTVSKLESALNEIFVTRRQQIQSGISYISNCMHELHAESVDNGYCRMIEFIKNNTTAKTQIDGNAEETGKEHLNPEMLLQNEIIVS